MSPPRAMNGARSRKMRGSLGDSWGDAEYESDGGASIHSASDFESEAGSDSEHEEILPEETDIATPLPPRTTRASSWTPQNAPVRTPVNRFVSGSRHSQSPMSSPRSQGTGPHSARTESSEPSFIMPSMSDYTGSPLRNPRMRGRMQPRTAGRSSQSSSVHSTPNRSRRQRPSMSAEEPRGQKKGPTTISDVAGLLFKHVVYPVLKYALSALGMAAEFFKPLVATVCIVFAVLYVTPNASSFIVATVGTALSPLCIVPGSSYLLPSICATQKHEPAFEEFMTVQSTFEEVLSASMHSFSLPQAMKRSEASIRDLKTRVKYSKLPSRSELEVEFQSFIQQARDASADLTRYNSRIGHTMDKVISTNRWTMQILSGISDRASSTGLLPRIASTLNPLSVFISSPPSLEEQIFNQYVTHVSMTKDDISALISNAEGLLILLNSLDHRLDLIADLAVRDGMVVSRDKEQLLSTLWSKLGGNVSQKKSFDDSLSVLSHVTQYRKVAEAHVSATLLKLQDIQAKLENLREGVAAPEVLGFRKDVPLSYHIGLIGLTVQRLSEGREDARRVETEGLRKLMGEGEERALPDAAQGEMGTGEGGVPTVYVKKGGKR